MVEGTSLAARGSMATVARSARAEVLLGPLERSSEQRLIEDLGDRPYGALELPLVMGERARLFFERRSPGRGSICGGVPT